MQMFENTSHELVSYQVDFFSCKSDTSICLCGDMTGGILNTCGELLQFQTCVCVWSDTHTENFVYFVI